METAHDTSPATAKPRPLAEIITDFHKPIPARLLPRLKPWVSAAPTSNPYFS